MKQFVALFHELDASTSTNHKVDALCHYFSEATDEDKLWTIALFTGRHPKRAIKSAQLRSWAAEAAGLPLWLFEECYHSVGDLSETIASVLPNGVGYEETTLAGWIAYIQSMHQLPDEEKKQYILTTWSHFNKDERFVFNKLTSGSFRVGVSQKLLVKALSKSTGIKENLLTHRIMGNWQPDATTYTQLILEKSEVDDISKPYPFYLAYALDQSLEDLGDVNDWLCEYKWDGIRCQLIKRNGQIFLWSRGEELITDRFPELANMASHIEDGTVLDAELVAMKDHKPMPFIQLQTRIGRKKITPQLQANVPVCLIAYDILEHQGIDLRQESMHVRRKLLVDKVRQINHSNLKLSIELCFHSWNDLDKLRAESRSQMAEGVMLKRKTSSYQSGRKRGDWWKWKVDPLTADAIMIYAMSGSGRRANLYSDYTFAVWDDNQKLVPFAKAYSGLTDAEIAELDNWIKRNTIEKFGPVRSVQPHMVFELGFEGINFSSRHKSGIAVRFPRILRWRRDKPANEADTLKQLKALIQNT
jgi:DNA ligase-1